MAIVDYTLPQTIERFYMYETIQFWWNNNVNPFVDQEFITIGYIKKVFRAMVDDDGKLKFDKYGYPIFAPNKERGVLH